MSFKPRPARPGRSFRQSSTRIENRDRLGPCYRCGAAESPIREVGEGQALQVRLCGACEVAVGAKPRGHSMRQAGLQARSSPPARNALEARARYPVCRSREEFLRLAEALVGRGRLQGALKALGAPTAWERAVAALEGAATQPEGCS